MRGFRTVPSITERGQALPRVSQHTVVRAPGRPNGNEACGRSAVGPGIRPSIQDLPREAAGLQVGGRSLLGLMTARAQ